MSVFGLLLNLQTKNVYVTIIILKISDFFFVQWYDLTKFKHPGGTLKPYHLKDATAQFEYNGHRDRHLDRIEEYKIGFVANEYNNDQVVNKIVEKINKAVDEKKKNRKEKKN
jgi:cytochrome b involved in lipid metabolism